MKQFIINIQDFIRRGILRIFPKPSSEGATYTRVVRKGYLNIPSSNGVLKVRHIFIFAYIALALLLIGCSTSRQMTTQLEEHTSVDTIYLSNVQYDSIYIYQDKLIDRSRDTLYIKDKSIEYRYRLLKDTIRVVERDSIPYEVTIVETKEIQRPLTWYDHFSRAVLWLNIGFAIYWLIRLFRRFHKP